jgi:hypothetical protein
MAMTRRGFVVASGLALLGALTARSARGLEAAEAAAAPVLRPAALGTSAGRCSHCGSLAHSTLDPACRQAAETRRALQVSARRLAQRGGRAGG